MTSSQSKLSSYFNLSKNNGIIVENGQYIPICGFGSANLSPQHPPLVLKNAFHAPNLIENLTWVRKFTTDNQVSIEGISDKDDTIEM